MPSLKVKNSNGKWLDIASANTHQHTTADIADLPGNIVADVAALKDKVGSESVAFQIQAAIGAVNVRHPSTHPASMITGLSAVATSGQFSDLKGIPENFGSVVGSFASEEDVYAENTLNFTFLDFYNAYHATIAENTKFSLEEGEEYCVVWDNEEYQRTAFAFISPIDAAECVAIGSPIVAGGEANEDKFAVVYDITHDCVHFFSTEELASHKVRIYKKIDIKMNWDNLLDKPFYSNEHEVVINPTTISNITFEGLGYTWQKVSDKTLPEGTVVGATISLMGMVFNITKDEVIAENEHGIGCLLMEQFPFLMVYKPGETTLSAFGQTATVNIPEVGTYMLDGFVENLLSESEDKSVIFKAEEIKKLNNKFIDILEGEDSDEIEIFPKQTVTWTGEDGVISSEFEIQQLPQLNKKYIVEFDGVEYECLPWFGEGICLGNQHMLSSSLPDTGEPFVVISFPDNDVNICAFIVKEEAISIPHEIRIYKPKTHMTVKSDNLPDPPFFDLIDMGLPTIMPDGSLVVAEDVDTTEIRAAAAKGICKFKLSLANIPIEAVTGLVYIPMADYYCYTGMTYYNSTPFVVMVDFHLNYISAHATPLAVASLS